MRARAAPTSAQTGAQRGAARARAAAGGAPTVGRRQSDACTRRRVQSAHATKARRRTHRLCALSLQVQLGEERRPRTARRVWSGDTSRSRPIAKGPNSRVDVAGNSIAGSVAGSGCPSAGVWAGAATALHPHSDVSVPRQTASARAAGRARHASTPHLALQRRAGHQPVGPTHAAQPHPGAGTRVALADAPSTQPSSPAGRPTHASQVGAPSCPCPHAPRAGRAPSRCSNKGWGSLQAPRAPQLILMRRRAAPAVASAARQVVTWCAGAASRPLPAPHAARASQAVRRAAQLRVERREGSACPGVGVVCGLCGQTDDGAALPACRRGAPGSAQRPGTRHRGGRARCAHPRARSRRRRRREAARERAKQGPRLLQRPGQRRGRARSTAA